MLGRGRRRDAVDSFRSKSSLLLPIFYESNRAGRVLTWQRLALQIERQPPSALTRLVCDITLSPRVEKAVRAAFIIPFATSSISASLKELGNSDVIASKANKLLIQRVHRVPTSQSVSTSFLASVALASPHRPLSPSTIACCFRKTFGLSHCF